MRKAILALAVACPFLFGQNNDPAVSFSSGPPQRVWTKLLFYTTVGGADALEYTCYANATQPEIIDSVTQIVDSSSTATVTYASAHGLGIGNRVVIAGVTGDTDLNGTYIVLTVPSTTTITITSSSVTDATYNNAGITSTSSAPRTYKEIWSISKNYYGASSLNAVRWAVDSSGKISSSGAQHSCDARSALAYQ